MHFTLQIVGLVLHIIALAILIYAVKEDSCHYQQ